MSWGDAPSLAARTAVEAYRNASPARRKPHTKAAVPSASAWNHVPTPTPPRLYVPPLGLSASLPGTRHDHSNPTPTPNPNPNTEPNLTLTLTPGP